STPIPARRAGFGFLVGGGGGIRTHGRLAPPAVFKTAPFGRSGTPPRVVLYRESIRTLGPYLRRTPSSGGTMKAPLLVVVAVLGAALLIVPALGLGSGDGRKVLEARVLAGLPQAYTGAAGAIRGVNGAGAA